MVLNLKKFIITILTLNIFLCNLTFAENIPIIVIAPGKTYQSKSTVGSHVTVINNKEIENSTDFFLGDILNKNSSGMNFFQNGGAGTNMGIQLRGLPKRYTTVYIDGVKMSDPSTPDNAYYFSHIMKNSIDRVEILKGSQNSLYGSGAIGGTLNLFTKRGKKGHHKNIEISGDSISTKNIFISLDGKENSYDYFLGLNNYSTRGISAMNGDPNPDDDGYDNTGIVANYGYQFDDKLRIENYLKYTGYLLEFDEATHNRADENRTNGEESSYSFKLIRDDGNLKNTLIYNKSYFKRVTDKYDRTSSDTYWGYRDALNFVGQYNFDLDTRIIYGLDNEFDRADFTTWAVTGNKVTDEAVYSQYIDLQFRPIEKLYSTIGFRRDEHTTAGAYQTGRATLAYNLNNSTKIRSSIGTGIRFATLNDYFYDTNVKFKEDLAPEKSNSFDLGIEKKINKYNLDLDFTIFRIEYDDNISNWEGNTDSGRTSGGSVIENSAGKIISKGFEFASLWKLNKSFNFHLNYAYTDAHDGEDCDDPLYAKWKNLTPTCIDDMPVAVPRHAINAKLKKTFSKNFNSSFLIRYVGETRNYGDATNNWEDVMLGDYIVLDLNNTYEIYDGYDLFLSLKNLGNKVHETAYRYNAMPRTVNFGLKRKF